MEVGGAVGQRALWRWGEPWGRRPYEVGGAVGGAMGQRAPARGGGSHRGGLEPWGRGHYEVGGGGRSWRGESGGAAVGQRAL